MGVRWMQLANLLHEHKALARIREAKQGGGEGRLARTGTARDEQARARAHQARKHAGNLWGEHPGRREVVKGERLCPHAPDGNRRAPVRNGRQHRMQARPIREPNINGG